MLELTSAEEDGSPSPQVDEPYDIRPDLTQYGIEEVERGVCEDTFENRSALRRARMKFRTVYGSNGLPAGMIAATTPEMLLETRMISMEQKKPLLVNPRDNNSDYMTGLDLLLDDDAIAIAPPWVIGATRRWQSEQINGGPPKNKMPKPMPVRCRIIKDDGLRCMLWGSGLEADAGVCRRHLPGLGKTGEAIERARKKLVQAAPYAVDVLEDLMENAESEPVRLKASTEILDRAGVRGGQDFNVDVTVSDERPAHQVVAERLARLAAGAASTVGRRHALEEDADETDETDITDAEVVEEDDIQDLPEEVIRTSPQNVYDDFSNDLEEEKTDDY